MKNKKIDKGLALFGNVNNLVKATKVLQQKINIHTEHKLSSCHPKNAATQGQNLQFRRNQFFRSSIC